MWTAEEGSLCGRLRVLRNGLMRSSLESAIMFQFVSEKQQNQAGRDPLGRS